MKIAVNARLLLPDRLDGIGRFTHETLQRITREHPEHEFVFIFDAKPNQQFNYGENVTALSIMPPARHPLLFPLWFELSLPWLLRKIKPDLLLSPDGFLPLSSKLPSVAVIHDLNFEHYPEDLPVMVRRYYRFFFPKFAQKATRLATVSQYSKNDIATLYKIDPSKIDVVYNGSNEKFVPLSADKQQLIKNKFTAGKEYFFFVGTLHPRKNLVNLFKAFDQYKVSDEKGIKLVIAGAKMWWTEEMEEACESMRYRNEVVFTGRVSDAELSGLMASALALTYVSYFEGFGIPIVEAFRCGTPVITSNVTSMPEVAGDAALISDPFSVDSIANAMTQIAGDSELREHLKKAGTIRSYEFTWEMTAHRLWGCIEKAVQA